MPMPVFPVSTPENATLHLAVPASSGFPIGSGVSPDTNSQNLHLVADTFLFELCCLLIRYSETR